ncbi:MAG TPA: DUF1501 domain-containing protein [Gemmataceae bacterium]|nr:DUF1501 domain-containing protein [Gemmataceae bacterium]
MNSSRRCIGPVSRRHFLKIGALTLGGAGLRGLLPLRLQAAATGQSPDTSVILIWLPGGPPHMETYDMKPDAPAEYRGAFRPIKTNVPGMDVCELLPMHARIADKFTLIRSVAHQFADHGGGHKRFLTGRDPRSPVGFVNDYPMVGSMVAKVREDRQAGVPNYIAGADPGRDQIDVYSFGAAYLGPSTHPFMIAGDPSSPKFKVKNISIAQETRGRLHDRLGLLQQLDSVPVEIDSSGAMEAMAEYRRKAVTLAMSDVAGTAFELSREPLKLRERYGMHAWGQRALLARRLVEQGASFVTMVMENPYQSGMPFAKDGTYNWDSHAVNCHIFNDARLRFPIYDRAVTALIEDIYARGLDRKVMVIVTGEFGRTPRISYAKGTQTNVEQPGRDHWPQAMSMLVCGGGMRTGQVVGSTNARGEHPKDRPLSPNDLWATMFRHLGIDYKTTSFLDHTGRPLPILPDGEPIAELL